MCGINGILNFDGSYVNEQDVSRMSDQMIFRGPDSYGSYINGNFGMSMRRLSIIDLDGGNQPISSKDGRYQVIMNGEIYNFIELRNDLIAKGHYFSTNSDTEILIHLFIEYREKFLDYLEGMYAFALYDAKYKKLIIARDRLGIKPLYYLYNKNKLIFSSSLDSIISLKSVEKDLNINSFFSFIGLSYVPSPETIWKNIFKLPPAHFIQIDNNNFRIKKYWDVNDFKDIDDTYESHVERVEEQLYKSIKLHARSDVPVGTYLSGGLDSSAVTCLFAENTAQPFHTFSIDFEDKKENESYYAGLISKKYNTIHHEYKINYEQAHNELSNFIPFMDEPIADSAIISSSFLSARAKEFDIKVMLSGAGGDEIFAGYKRHYFNKRNILSGKLSFMRNSSIANFLQRNTNAVNILTLLQSKPLSFATSTSGVNLGTVYYALKNKTTFNKIMNLNHDHFHKSFELAKKSKIDDSLYIDLNNYLLDNVLALTDKTSMSQSIEARVPLLDHKLVQSAIQSTSKFLRKNNFDKSKMLLKSTMKKKLPSEILTRKKMGFNSPLNSWITKLFQFGNNELFVPKSDIIKETFNIDKINNLIGAYDKNNKYSEFLFMIYVFDNWLSSKK